jgi:hypothetical protein
MSQLKEVCATTKQTQVESQLVYALNSVERLNFRVEDLITRLKPILDLSNPCEDAPAAPECVLVDLASRIRTLDKNINHACNKIESVLTSIEL